MATQQGLPSSQVRLDIGSIWCKKIEFAKTLENMALTLTRDWLIKWCLHPLQIISVIFRCWWRALQFKKKKFKNSRKYCSILTRVWHILNCIMFYTCIHSLIRSTFYSYWDVWLMNYESQFISWWQL